MSQFSLSLSKKEEPQKPVLNLFGSTDSTSSTSSKRSRSRSASSSKDKKETLREKFRVKFVKILDDNDQLGQVCENCLYEYLCDKTNNDFPDRDFESEYIDRGLMLIRNLDPEGSVGNFYLKAALLQKQITPEKMVRMSSKDLNPDKWNLIKEERLKEIQMESQQQVSTTDMFECRRCHKNKTTYYQLQIRSQDEPMTNFITCVNCGCKWTI